MRGTVYTRTDGRGSPHNRLVQNQSNRMQRTRALRATDSCGAPAGCGLALAEADGKQKQGQKQIAFGNDNKKAQAFLMTDD